MRNLKKILALVLALMMVVSVMVVASAASFNDYDDVDEIDSDYAEAVEVLTNMGVFRGFDGGFQPDTKVTRAEVATLVYRILTGDVTDKNVDQYKDYGFFTDVAEGNWFSGYVNYAANGKYVVGVGEDRYDPQGNVTGYQLLVIMLRAIGYGKNGEFEGTSEWTIRAATTAEQLGITDGLKTSLGSELTREEVAYILFNAIQVNKVEYTPALGYQNAWDESNIGFDVFGLEKTIGEITGTNRKTGTTTMTPVISWRGNDNLLDNNNRVDVINTSGDWTQIGYMAYAYTVPTANAKTRTAMSDVTVTGDSMGISTNGTPISSLSTKGNAAFIGELTDPNANVRYYYNGELCDTAQERSDAIAAANRVGVKVDFIDNDAGSLAEVVVVTEYTTAYVTGIANTTNTGSQAVTDSAYNLTTTDGSNTPSVAVKVADMVCADALAVGDLVTYVEYNGDYYTVKAPLTTNTFTRINYSTVGSNNAISYVIGGTEYLIANWDVKAFNQFNRSVAKANLNSGNLNKNFNVYTDPYGHIIYAAPVADVVNYLYVLANDHTVATTGLTNARVVNADGSITSVNIAGLSLPNGTTRSSFDLNDLVTDYSSRMYGYTVNGNGSYTLVELSNVLTDADYSAGTSTVYGDEGTAGVNTASVVVDVRGVGINSTSATVYTGYGEVPSFTNGQLYYVAGIGGWVTVSFLADGVDLADEFIVYKTSYNYTENVGGTQYYYLDVMKDGVKVENYQLTADEYTTVQYYGVGVYSFNMDGSLDEYTAFPEEWTAVIWQNGSIRTAGGQYFTYDGTNVKFNVLNIANGTINDYTMEYGRNYHAYLVKSGTAVTEIYIVVGELASLPELDPYFNPAYQYKDNSWYVYAKTFGYITDVLDTVVDMTAAPLVTLDGVELDWASPLSNTQFVAALTYEQWSNLDEDAQFVITPAPSNEIAVNNKLSFSDEVQYVAVTAKADSYQVITVYSQSKGAGEITESYTFTIYFAPAETGAVLTSKDAKVASVNAATKVITVKDDELSINEFMDNFEVSKNAEVEWTFWNAQGVVAEEDYFQTMQNVKKFTAVVTAEDKSTATYMDKDSADVKALADAKTAAEKTLTEYVEKVEKSTDPKVKDVTAEDLAKVLAQEIAAMKKLPEVTDVNNYVKETPPAGTGIQNIWDEAVKIQAAKDAAAAVTATVKTYEELAAAIADTKVKTIILADDIALDAQINIRAGVTLDGAGYTIDATKVKTTSAIVIADGCIVENVTVKGNTRRNSWDSNYGIQVYGNGIKASLEDVTVSGFDAAILVNGAELTLKGTVDVSNNEFGGIEISKGSAITTNAKLIVNATVVNTTESSTAPTAWIPCDDKDGSNAQGSIEGVVWVETIVEKDDESFQLWYTLDV